MQNLDENAFYLYLLLSILVNLAFSIIISLGLRPQQNQSQMSKELLINDCSVRQLKLYVSIDPTVRNILGLDQMDRLEELLTNIRAQPQPRPQREKSFKGNYADLAAGTLE